MKPKQPPDEPAGFESSPAMLIQPQLCEADRGADASNGEHMNRAPLIVAIVSLLLPILYVGSYFAMVNPWNGSDVFSGKVYPIHYCSRVLPPYVCWVAFRPIQTVDMQLRPEFWQKPTDDPNFAGVGP